jgi:hypothetical protein
VYSTPSAEAGCVAPECGGDALLLLYHRPSFGGKALTPRVWPPVRERVVLPKAALSPPRPVGAHDPYADAVVLGDEIEGDPGTDSLFGKMVFNPFVRPAVLRCKGWAWLKHNFGPKPQVQKTDLMRLLIRRFRVRFPGDPPPVVVAPGDA